MTTTHRRESAPNRADVERIVVGPTLFSTTNGPIVQKPRANVLYALPGEGAAVLGSAASSSVIREVVERWVYRRPPKAIWLRDVPWFVDAWGTRSTGRLERSLADVAAGHDLVFVSWLKSFHAGQTGRLGEQTSKADSRVAPRHEQ